MAINKVSNRKTTSHAALRNSLEYVLRDQKIKDGLVYMTGPAPEELTWDTVYQTFIEEKRIWHKDSGRMYAHNIISFHKDEKITPEEALEFGKEFAERWFPGHQTLIAVHQDKDHIHIHLITNSVSYETGLKLHTTKADLQAMKEMTNEMCLNRGLSIAVKGEHFDGSKIALSEPIAWSEDKYRMIINQNEDSYVLDCARAVEKAMKISHSRDEFIKAMENGGWHTKWSDTRKHITFENEDGMKVRDSNLTKTFNMNISKESLNQEFESKKIKIKHTGIRF